MRDASYIRLFVNGMQAANTNIGNVAVNNVPGRTLKLAKIDVSSYGLDGRADEARISNVARSSSWVSAEYANQNSPSTFYSVGQEEISASVPVVNTLSASSTTSSFVTLSGEITSDGGATIIERGIVYATSSAPTILDNKATSSGTLGSYTINLNSLIPGTTYHYRAYAINSEGISYGSDNTFTTLSLQILKVVIDYTKVSSDLTDFPVYINLNNLGSFTTLEANSIRVYTNNTLTNEIPREIVSNKEMYFKANLSSFTDTTFYISYDGARPDYAKNSTYGAQNVWTNGYEAVYHLDSDFTDSTANANNMSGNGGVIAGNVTGKLGSATNFDGIDDYLEAQNMSFTTGTGTLSVWTNLNSKNDYDGFISASDNLGLLIGNDINHKLVFNWDGSLDENEWTNNLSLPINKDLYVAVAVSSNQAVGYVGNSGILNSDTNTNTNNSHTFHDVIIGSDRKLINRNIDGWIDEARLSNIARSSGWISTEYNNQNSPNTFYYLNNVPRTVPDSPTIGSANVGIDQVAITFTPPINYGNSPITNYTVISTPGNILATGSTSPIIVTGLSRGINYTFKVKATNAIGDSIYSSSTNQITTLDTPSAPQNLAATVKGSSMDLSWTPPTNDGGQPVTDYIIQYQKTVGGSWYTFPDGTSTQATTTVTGLSNANSYDFRVAAVNSVGQGSWSSVVSATPGEPAQVIIQSFSDTSNPSIATNIRITNEGFQAYEYHYTWCVTDSLSNLCGGGDDVSYSTAAKLIQPGENFDTTLNSNVPNPGNYYFHIVANYGSASSTAIQFFSTLDQDPPTFNSASIDTSGTILTINWTEITSPPIMGSNGLSLQGLTHGAVILNNITNSGTTTTANLSRPIYADESPTLSYSTSTGTFSDSASAPNYVVGFTNKSIINNSNQNFNHPPQADFVFSTSSDPLVSFINSSSDSDGPLTQFSWLFGDGSTSSLENPTHTYVLNGNYTVTLTVTDNAGAQASTTKTFTISQAQTSPSVTTLGVNSLGSDTATLLGEVTNTGNANLTELGFQYGLISGNLDHVATTTPVTGNFSLNLTGLNDETTYYYRSFARNSEGVSYGSEQSFTTLDINAPNLINIQVQNISQTGATITWATNELATSKVIYSSDLSYASSTESSTTTTNHSLILGNLLPETIYNYKVISADMSNNTSTSTSGIFTTLTQSSNIISNTGSAGSVSPLILSPGSLSDISKDKVVITYQNSNNSLSSLGLSCNFSQDLKLGMTSPEVKCLQVALNHLGFTVSLSGTGSIGEESNYFGIKTKQAVEKFQDLYSQEVLVPAKLISPTGYFGKSTQEKLNMLISGKKIGC